MDDDPAPPGTVADDVDAAGGPFVPADFGIGDLFDRVTDAVIVGSAVTGQIVLWNHGAEALFGYSREQAVRLRIDALIPPPLRARHRAGLRRFAHGGVAPLVEHGRPVTLPALRASGEEISIELRLSKVGTQPMYGVYVMALARLAPGT